MRTVNLFTSSSLAHNSELSRRKLYSLSLSPQFSADVIGCSIDENRTEVLALDTFNPASERTNELDDSEKDTNGHPVCPITDPLVLSLFCYYVIVQGDVVQFSREFVDGRIICV